MRTQLLVALSVLLISGAGSAQVNLSTVEVRAGAADSVMVSCSKPDSVTAKDVVRVLSIDDPRTTAVLRRKFISAASAACKAGIPHILVSRGAHDTLTWKRME